MGDYLKLFETDTERVTYEDSENYIEPYVSYVEGDNTVHYNKPPFFCKLTLSDDSVVELEGSGQLTSAMVSPYKSTLISAEIGKKCTSLGVFAFQGCSSLTTVTIPDSVTSIGKGAFQQCGVTNITIPDSVISIGDYAFMDSKAITNVVLSNNITSIGINTFDGCNNLTSVTIPDSVTSIGDSAFRYCYATTSVTIPSSVTSIGNYAFWYNNHLTSITIEATTPPTLGAGAFSDTNNCPIYVPSASVETYKAPTGWTNLASRIQAIPTQP